MPAVALAREMMSCSLVLICIALLVCSNGVAADQTDDLDGISSVVDESEQNPLAFIETDDNSLDLSSDVDKRRVDNYAFSGGIGKRRVDRFGFAGGIGKRRVDRFGFAGGIGKRRVDRFGFAGGIGKRRVDRFGFAGGIGKRRVDRFGFAGGIGKRRVDRFGFAGGIGKKRIDPFGFSGGIGKRDEFDELTDDDFNNSELNALPEIESNMEKRSAPQVKSKST